MLAVIILQVPTPGEGVNPYAWLAALMATALGVVAFWWKSSLEARIVALEKGMATDRADCEARVSRLERKLDESTDIIRKQAASQIDQIAAQQIQVVNQQKLIDALQAAITVKPS